MKNRYYNRDTRNQAVFEGENHSSNLIKDDDERVLNFFQPTPEGYIKAYDENNLPFNELIPVHVVTQDELKEQFKQNRATIMNSIGWIHERIQSQAVIIQGGYAITAKYTVAQAIEYYLYKQELRDRPSIITDWTSISYPVVPQHVYDAMEKEIKALCQELQCDPVV